MNDFKAFIEHSNDMDDIYKNVEEYNSNKKRKILITFMLCFWFYVLFYYENSKQMGTSTNCI